MSHTIRAVIVGMILAFVGFQGYDLIREERAKRAEQAAARHISAASVVAETPHGQVVLAMLDAPDGMRCIVSVPSGNIFCYLPAQAN